MPEPDPQKMETGAASDGKPVSPAAPASRLPEVMEVEGALVLVKGAQRYVFRCAPGQEHELLLQLPRQVADPSSNLDWFDAAVLSHALGQRMRQRLKAG